jgi:Zn-dependent M28 family amino/carboxypeptidase
MKIKPFFPLTLKQSLFVIFITLYIPLLALGCQMQQSPMVDQRQNPELPITPTLKPTEFDGERALEHVRKQVSFGARYAGSEALKQTREYIKKELESYGLKVRTQAFSAKTPNPKFPQVEMVNLIAEIPGERPEVIILASHYDTKWFPDINFVGANDGGSSTGVLLELAHQLAKTKPLYTLWLTFFDGEEAMNGEWTDGDNTYGSRHMAEQLRSEGQIRNIKAMILMDMVGDKDLALVRDGNSVNWLTDIIWRTAKLLGYSKHFPNNTMYLDDDHVPFLRAGIPAVDLIDFNYGSNNRYWHTNEDTIDKLSAESLKVIGDTLLRSLPEIAAHLK